MRQEFRDATAAMLRVWADTVEKGTENVDEALIEKAEETRAKLDAGEQAHLNILGGVLNWFEDAQVHMRSCRVMKTGPRRL